ncbi:MAG: hypothetical protein ACLFTT_06010, partial [Candidatus Hydrogenedentota bacterium]
MRKLSVTGWQVGLVAVLIMSTAAFAQQEIEGQDGAPEEGADVVEGAPPPQEGPPQEGPPQEGPPQEGPPQ